ncbi:MULTISPECIES: RNase E specificity factor CsrD [Shewanella]|uniref:RNase E specificity factor CsrD n=1 Tax=Shewanella TaxID=22 RepID=UPI0008DE9D32|nr:RNase E specificity factor CsrD [Shewanella algae]OHY52385.1 RNase E specificity factor CsrD [Shewanella algae]
MKLTRILTKKLTSFWLLSLTTVAFVFLLCAMMSFLQLTYKFQQQKVTELETMLSNQYQPSSNWELESWLPPMLIAYNAASFKLWHYDKLLFEYKGNIGTENLVRYQSPLKNNPGIRMELELPQPFSQHRPGWYEVLIILVGVGAVLAFVRFGYLWYSRQLEGIEELAQRSRLILLGEHEKALAMPGKGKPRLINRALSRLLEELADAQKERARFDKFIRSNTFLDPDTRIGNRLFLKNRLDALSNEQGMIAHGVLYLLELEDLDLLQQQLGDSLTLELLRQNVNGISQILQSQPNSFFARRSHNQFAIVVTQISLAEADQLAIRLLKVCQSQVLPKLDNADNFYHLGGAYFKVGDGQQQLLEEAEMALRAAQLQGINTWFMYDKGAVDQEFAKGSVRWRSFLEMALVNKRFLAYTQPVMDCDGKLHHREVFTRARDPEGNLVRATLFLPMAVKCGLMPQIERQTLERVLFELLPSEPDKKVCFSINLSLDSLMSRAFIRWLRTTLLEYRDLTGRLIFEVSEDIAAPNQEKIASRLQMIRKMGARLCVDHVGQQVISTQYIQDTGFELIKLHRSIVRQIHLRPENQLFVRSLIGGLYRTEVQVCAEGVELFEEWQTLRILGVSAAQGSWFSEPMPASA